MFTTPREIEHELSQRIRCALVNQACNEIEALQLMGRKELRRHVPSRLITGFDPYLAEVGKPSYGISYNGLMRLTHEQTKRATDLLEDRITANLSETDTIDEVVLKISPNNIIEGTVLGYNRTGEKFTITARLLWNYRYGSNSANGVLTVYPQFRGKRNGAPALGEFNPPAGVPA